VRTDGIAGRAMRLLAILLVARAGLAQTWIIQPGGTVASLRGVSAVNSSVAWASGAGGTWLRTIDGGASWKSGSVRGAEELDFRGVRAFDANTAYLLASGPGAKSRIYKTIDGGASWKPQFANPDPAGFLDAIVFWDGKRGLALGDPVNGNFVVLTTADGGETWERRHGPPALPHEGAFAASNSCAVVRGSSDVWFGTGGPGGARVFHSSDGGERWSVASTPIRNDGAAAGIFSLAFSDKRHGVAVGGDYSKPEDSQRNIAVTDDGGLTWSEPSGARPRGYRSAAAFVASRKLWIATGPTGSEFARGRAQHWVPFDHGSFNALAVAAGGAAWTVGPNGRIGKLRQ
jgi:photosystem II stability/assembly factor-like uncharacterized protein